MTIPITLGILAGITVGIVEIVKRIGLPKRYLPIFALVIGVALVSLGMKEFSITSALNGLIIGLLSCGLWSGAKKVITDK